MVPAAHSATLLFKTNFGPDVSLGAPYSFSANGAWQDFTGTDAETGFGFPFNFFDAEFSGIQLITVDTITPTTIGDYITTDIRPVLGPFGTPAHELYQSVKIKSPVGMGGSQAPFLLQRGWDKGDVTDLYFSYWFKHQANLNTQLDKTVTTGNWRVQFEFKTGGYLNSWPGDYRILTYVMINNSGKLYWLSKGDNGANGPWDLEDYWQEVNQDVPVPVDEWFFFEVCWHHSAGSDGRYWAAVNGQVIADHHGPNMGKYNLPITRIMFINPYSGGHAPVDSHLTGLSIWSGFPCGEGVSCYQSLSTPSHMKIK